MNYYACVCVLYMYAVHVAMQSNHADNIDLLVVGQNGQQLNGLVTG